MVDQAVNNGLVMVEHVEGDAAAEAYDHDVSRFRILELLARNKLRSPERLDHLGSAGNGRKSMVGNDEDIGFIENVFILERFQYRRQILVAILECGKGGFRTGR